MRGLFVSGVILVLCIKTGLCGYCDQHTIPFPGIVKDRTRFYLDKESFLVSCGKGYKLAVNNSSYTCNKGVWSGLFPPCVPVDCSVPPPPVRNGKIKSYSGHHLTKVEYECDEHFFPAYQYEEQCLFGEWKGSPPACKDSRCYLKDLKKKEGLLLNHPFLETWTDITNSGEFLDPYYCDDGYKETGVKPLCVRGEWTEYGTPPCREENCTVNAIQYGTFMRPKEKRVWTWDRFSFERIETFKKVDVGTKKPPSTVLYISCDSGYVFRGNGLNNDTTICQKGNWTPKPECRK